MKKFHMLKVFIFVGLVSIAGLAALLAYEEPRTREEQKVALWINQLGDKDPKVREDAASNLKEFGKHWIEVEKDVYREPKFEVDETQLEKLFQALDDPNLKIRLAVLTFLSDSSVSGVLENLSNSQVGNLFQALDDPNPEVKVGVLSFLSHLARKGLVEKQKINETHVEKLLQLLDDPDPKVRVGVLSFLSHLGGRDIVQKVKIKLKDQDAEVRTKAAVALFRLRPLGDIGPLIAAAEDENEEVRRAVAVALGDSKYPEAYQVLVRLYQDERDEVRRGVVSALGDYGDKRTEPILIALLNDPNPDIRWGAAYVLGHIGEKESIGPLIEVLGKKDVDIRGGLHDIVNLALFQITLQKGLEGYESWDNWWKGNKDSFDPVERVRELLQSENHISVSFALRRIKSHRMEEFKPELRSMLSEKDNIKLEPWVSALSLAEWGELDGLAYFFWALEKDPGVTEELRKFTGQFFYGDPQAWLKWWKENKSRIRWNEKQHIFEVVEEDSG